MCPSRTYEGSFTWATNFNYMPFYTFLCMPTFTRLINYSEQRYIGMYVLIKHLVFVWIDLLHPAIIELKYALFFLREYVFPLQTIPVRRLRGLIVTDTFEIHALVYTRISKTLYPHLHQSAKIPLLAVTLLAPFHAIWNSYSVLTSY